ncbi:MAG TPA: J domain-containing protein, partial [Myxococcota bacterium]|nr:J domain-containing protein [Myxococcota bacterium]
MDPLRRELVPHARPDVDWKAMRLDAVEGFILSRVDGVASVGEICLGSGLGEERTLAILEALAQRKLIDLSEPGTPSPPARPAPPPGGVPRTLTPPMGMPRSAMPGGVRSTSQGVPRPSAAPPGVPRSGSPASTSGPPSPTPSPLPERQRSATGGFPRVTETVRQPPGGTPTPPPAPPTRAPAPGAVAPSPRPPGPAAAASEAGRPPSPSARPAAATGGVEDLLRTFLDMPEAPAVDALTPGAHEGSGVDFVTHLGVNLPRAELEEKVDLPDDQRRRILATYYRLNTVDYYEFFGVEPAAPDDVIKKRFRETFRQFNPDQFFRRNIGSYKAKIEAIARFAKRAYDVLSDPQARRDYDALHGRTSEVTGSKPGRLVAVEESRVGQNDPTPTTPSA